MEMPMVIVKVMVMVVVMVLVKVMVMVMVMVYANIQFETMFVVDHDLSDTNERSYDGELHIIEELIGSGGSKLAENIHLQAP